MFCADLVDSATPALCCNFCEGWAHTGCIGMGVSEEGYELHQCLSCSLWICENCLNDLKTVKASLSELRSENLALKHEILEMKSMETCITSLQDKIKQISEDLAFVLHNPHPSHHQPPVHELQTTRDTPIPVHHNRFDSLAQDPEEPQPPTTINTLTATPGHDSPLEPQPPASDTPRQDIELCPSPQAPLTQSDTATENSTTETPTPQHVSSGNADRTSQAPPPSCSKPHQTTLFLRGIPAKIPMADIRLELDNLGFREVGMEQTVTSFTGRKKFAKLILPSLQLRNALDQALVNSTLKDCFLSIRAPKKPQTKLSHPRHSNPPFIQTLDNQKQPMAKAHRQLPHLTHVSQPFLDQGPMPQGRPPLLCSPQIPMGPHHPSMSPSCGPILDNRPTATQPFLAYRHPQLMGPPLPHFPNQDNLHQLPRGLIAHANIPAQPTLMSVEGLAPTHLPISPHNVTHATPHQPQAQYRSQHGQRGQTHRQNKQ